MVRVSESLLYYTKATHRMSALSYCAVHIDFFKVLNSIKEKELSGAELS